MTDRSVKVSDIKSALLVLFCNNWTIQRGKKGREQGQEWTD